MPKNQFNEMRFHAPSGQWYVWAGNSRTYLGKDEARARELHGEMKARYLLELSKPVPLAEVPKAAPDNTINSLIIAYVGHLTRKGTDARRWSRIRPALDLLSEHCGSLPADRFRARAFRDLRGHMLALRTRKGEQVSRTWVNHLGSEVRNFVRWSSEEELLPSEAAGSVLLVRPLGAGDGGRETELRQPCEPGAAEDTLEYLWSPVRQMVELQLLTGVRPGELCDLKPAHISRSPDQKITLPRTRRQVAAVCHNGVLIWLYVPSAHKTLRKGKARIVPLGPKCQAILSPLLEGRSPFAHVFDPRTTKRPPCGKPWTRSHYAVSGYYEAVQNAIRSANRSRPREDPPRPLIPRWFPYQIRHKLATDVGDEYDADTAAAILGHAGMDSIGTYQQQALNKALKVAAERG